MHINIRNACILYYIGLDFMSFHMRMHNIVTLSETKESHVYIGEHSPYKDRAQ